MKKIVFMLFLAVVSLTANAQFQKGTNYVNTSLSGLDLTYHSGTKFHFGVSAIGGHFVADEWMVNARFGYEHQHVKNADNMNNLEFGAGFRRYFQKNGLFVGCGAMFEHVNVEGSKNSIKLEPEFGYCYYVNHFLSIEPSVYYGLSLNHFSTCSKAGLKIGLGFYF